MADVIVVGDTAMDSSKYRIAIVAAEFDADLIDAMIAAARAELDAAGAKLVELVRVAGAYEVPLIAGLLLERRGIDGVVVLGYIERGDTLHGEVMGHVVHQRLVEMQPEYYKPIGIGVIGPGATLDQAEVRKVPYATAAVRAVLKSCEIVKKFRPDDIEF